MTGSCIAQGLRTGRRSLGLVTLLWFWTYALAAIAAYPARVWLGRGFNFAPESDRMLSGFSFMTLGELSQYDRSSVSGLLLVVVAGVAMLALLANPLVSGGLIENLISQDDSTVLQRFARGAGRFFWRYLRLLVWGGVTAGIVLGALAAALSFLTERLSESPWEPAGVLGALAQGTILFLAGGLLLTALDFARVRVALEDSRRTLRTWCASLGFVLAKTPSTLALYLAPVALFAAILVVYGAYLRFVPAHTTVLILLLVLLQQAVMYCRASLRVALVASVLDFHRQSTPPPPPAEAPAEPLTPPEPATVEPAPAHFSENPDEQVQI